MMEQQLFPAGDSASPGVTGRNLYRMQQHYKNYRDSEKVAPLVQQIPAKVSAALTQTHAWASVHQFYALNIKDGN